MGSIGINKNEGELSYNIHADGVVVAKITFNLQLEKFPEYPKGHIGLDQLIIRWLDKLGHRECPICKGKGLYLPQHIDRGPIIPSACTRCGCQPQMGDQTK